MTTSAYTKTVSKFPPRAQSSRDYAVAFVRSLCEPVNEDVGHLRAVEGDPDLATGFGCALLRARMAPPPVLRQAAKTIRLAGVPALVVSGGWNPTFDAVCQVVARVVHGRHVVVPATNHFPQLENADEFNRVIVAFMREAGNVPRVQPR